MFWAASVLLKLLTAIFVVFFGVTVAGNVVAKDLREGKTPKYTVAYNYSVGRQIFHDKNEITHEEYDSLKLRDKIAIRVLKASPDDHSQIVFSGESRWSYVRSLLFETFFINFIVGVFLCNLYIVPAIQRRLITRGLPTLGRITDVKKFSGKSISYELKYEFAPIEYSNTTLNNRFQALPITQEKTAKIQSKMSVSERDSNGANVDALVTILFDIYKPKRNLIYKFADYEVVN